MKSITVFATIALVSSAIVGCDSAHSESVTRRSAADSARADSITRARQDSVNRAQPGYVVDSIFPPEVELARFRKAIGGKPVMALMGGSESREALARRVVAAVAANDTAALRGMVVTIREFADLMYPSSPFMHPPYRQPPGLAWMQIVNPSVSGFKRLMARRGGMRFTYVGHSCKPPEKQGVNRLWLDCQLRLVSPESPADTITQRWFAGILERDGRFKIISYANQF